LFFILYTTSLYYINFQKYDIHIPKPPQNAQAICYCFKADKKVF